jgi:hypothetical protein
MQSNQSTCRVAIAHMTAAKTAVAPDTMLSTENKPRARCNTIAPTTAPTPKQPSSKPYPSELSVKFFATAGSSAQKAPIAKVISINGEGAGVFHFSAEPQYVSQLSALGFNGVDADKQFSMAVLGVSVAFAKETKAENLKGLETDKLIAFRIFNVNREFIEALRKAGVAANDADKLVAFRIHGVSPEMVNFLHQAGYQPDEDTLVAMRIHGVTPDIFNN